MGKSIPVRVKFRNLQGEQVESVEVFLEDYPTIELTPNDINQILRYFGIFECAVLWELTRGCILEDETGYHPTEFLLENHIGLTEESNMYIMPLEGLRFYFTGLIKIEVYKAESFRKAG